MGQPNAKNTWGDPCEVWFVPAEWVTARGDERGRVDHYEVRAMRGPEPTPLAAGLLKIPVEEVAVFGKPKAAEPAPKGFDFREFLG